MVRVTDGTQLQLTTSTDISREEVQLKLLRYQSHFQNVRNKLSEGKSGFGPFRVNWECSGRGMSVYPDQELGINPIPNRATFDNQLKQAYARLSRTKLNNLKRSQGKTSLQPYVA